MEMTQVTKEDIIENLNCIEFDMWEDIKWAIIEVNEAVYIDEVVDIDEDYIKNNIDSLSAKDYEEIRNGEVVQVSFCSYPHLDTVIIYKRILADLSSSQDVVWEEIEYYKIMNQADVLKNIAEETIRVETTNTGITPNINTNTITWEDIRLYCYIKGYEVGFIITSENNYIFFVYEKPKDFETVEIDDKEFSTYEEGREWAYKVIIESLKKRKV